MKSVATVNSLVVALLNTWTATAVTDIDDLKDILNVTLDPAISIGATVFMNQDGFNKFDKMKDTDGNYLLEVDPQNATRKLLSGHPVVVVPNKVLATRVGAGDDDGEFFAPIFIGNMTEAITLFDRQAISLLSTNIGGSAFTKNRTEIRALMRHDAKKVDVAALAFAEI